MQISDRVEERLTIYVTIGYQLWRGARHWVGIAVVEQLTRAGHRVVLFLARPARIHDGNRLSFLAPLGVEVCYPDWLTATLSQCLHQLGKSGLIILTAIARRQSFDKTRSDLAFVDFDQLNYRWLHRALDQRAQSYPPHVLHVFGATRWNCAAVAWAHEKKIPIVYTETGDASLAWRTMGILFEASLPKITAITAHGENLLPAFRRLNYTGPIEIISFGIPDPLGDGRVPTQAAESPGREDQLTIGCAARLDSAKGIEYLIEAFALIARQYAGVRLRIAGEGSARSSLERLVIEKGLQDRVEFQRPYDIDRGMREFMTGIGIFALPSLTEGMPVSIIEAMAFGKPVVATSVGSVPELLADGAGFVVPPCDACELSRSLAKLIRDPELREKMGRTARSRFVENHQAESLVKKYEALYRRASL